MKRLTLYLMTAFLLGSFVPTQLKAEGTPTEIDSTRSAGSVEANSLIIRLNEIKEMDKSKLTSTEKKQLKKEVRSLKTRLKAISGGVYLSTGAIIIIILLLILLL